MFTLLNIHNLLIANNNYYKNYEIDNIPKKNSVDKLLISNKKSFSLFDPILDQVLYILCLSLF